MLHAVIHHGPTRRDLGVDDAGAVVVGEQHVVKVVEQPRRNGSVLVGKDPAVDVEQFAGTVLRSEFHQIGHLIRDLGKPYQPGEALHVLNRGRSKRGEVTPNEIANLRAIDHGAKRE